MSKQLTISELQEKVDKLAKETKGKSQVKAIEAFAHFAKILCKGLLLLSRIGLKHLEQQEEAQETREAIKELLKRGNLQR